MTSIATGLGLVPMSLGIGEGSELQVPLARVVIEMPCSLKGGPAVKSSRGYDLVKEI